MASYRVQVGDLVWFRPVTKDVDLGPTPVLERADVDGHGWVFVVAEDGVERWIRASLLTRVERRHVA